MSNENPSISDPQLSAKARFEAENPWLSSLGNMDLFDDNMQLRMGNVSNVMGRDPVSAFAGPGNMGAVVMNPQHPSAGMMRVYLPALYKYLDKVPEQFAFGNVTGKKLLETAGIYVNPERHNLDNADPIITSLYPGARQILTNKFMSNMEAETVQKGGTALFQSNSPAWQTINTLAHEGTHAALDTSKKFKEDHVAGLHAPHNTLKLWYAGTTPADFTVNKLSQILSEGYSNVQPGSKNTTGFIGKNLRKYIETNFDDEFTINRKAEGVVEQMAQNQTNRALKRLEKEKLK